MSRMLPSPRCFSDVANYAMRSQLHKIWAHRRVCNLYIVHASSISRMIDAFDQKSLGRNEQEMKIMIDISAEAILG